MQPVLIPLRSRRLCTGAESIYGNCARGRSTEGNEAAALEDHLLAFYFGLSLICASTLMYEVVLTRLLSVLCWYYLAFVSISMAMFGMTAGALAVQLCPGWFKPSDISSRLAQAAFAMAVSMPVALVIMLAVPLEVSLAVETLFSFLLFSAVIAVPFFFSGVVVCLSLTRTPFPSAASILQTSWEREQDALPRSYCSS